MPIFHVTDRLKQSAARFAGAERGNVAMMFAIALVPMLGFIGAAIDYSRAVSARSAMQAAADATALMISKEATSLTAEQITTKAKAYFTALYNRSDVGNVTFNAVYSPNSGNGASVKVDATGRLPTDFMKVAGLPNMDINASSTTKWGNIRYRVALALDNTGSMASANKIGELKKAATKLIDDFYAMAKADEDVYISIVPFAKDVNIGTGFKNANWLRWDDTSESWDRKNRACSGIANASWYSSRNSCQNAGGTWGPASHDTWNGCVMDRDKDYDTQNTPPSSSTLATMVWPEQYNACPTELLAMTPVRSKKQTLLDKIDAMQPNGGTNQGIGVFWAWMTHSQAGPFPALAKDANYAYIDAVVLLTDGLNTQNRYDGNGSSHSSAVDDRQAILCSNMRTAGIRVFTIQVATDNDPLSTVTKNCSSEPNNPNYFSYIAQASQMTVQFQNIFKELARLRVAS
jgi:Flp pilus assembly protein TadG